MDKKHPHKTPTDNDVNITGILMAVLIGLLLVWSTGTPVPQLWRDVMISIGSDTASIQKDGIALPL